MSDHQQEEQAVEDLDVPESDAEQIGGGMGLGKKLSPASLKIDVERSSGFGWEG